MRKLRFIFVLGIVKLAATVSAVTIHVPYGQPTIQAGVDALSNKSEVRLTRDLCSMPLTFTENQGQWDESVLFRTDAGGATMWFTADGAIYQFTRRIPSDQDPHGFDDSVIPAHAGRWIHI